MLLSVELIDFYVTFDESFDLYTNFTLTSFSLFSLRYFERGITVGFLSGSIFVSAYLQAHSGNSSAVQVIRGQ